MEDPRHRGGHRLIRDRPFVCANILALPFADKAFDYVICNQVVEHVPGAPQALREISRVGRRGLLATPSEFAEFITPYTEHLWVFARRGNHVFLKRKQVYHV